VSTTIAAARTFVRHLFVFAACVTACFAQSQAADPLVNLNASIDRLIRRVAPSVVQIIVASYGPQADQERRNAGVTFGRQRVIGSGFVIDSAGYIMTNAHVVNGAARIQVVLPPVAPDHPDATEAISTALSTRTTILPAIVVGVASDLDIALLKVEAGKLPPLPLAAYRELRQGEMVFAFGSPEGLRNTVTHGVISAVARQNDQDSTQIAIQTDAPINPGNSGGPLVNIKGEVVGMDTFILSQSGGNEGLGFAIPSATIRVAYRQLKQYGRLRRQEIGIGIQTITPALATGLHLPQSYGVIISDTLPGGPAAAAGMKPGDILTSVDGQPAENVPTVSYNFMLHDAGDKVHIEALRGNKKLTFDVPLVEEKHDIDGVLALATPEKNLVAELGILGVEIDTRLAPMLTQLRNQFGIITAARTSGGPREIPLLPGDVILSLNDLPTMTLEGLRTALGRLAPADPVVLQIERDGKLMYLTFSLE
jgi:serine protease Do